MLNDGTCPGEGEHKIVNAMMTNETEEPGRHCIVGNDSDLFVILLCRTRFPRFLGDGGLLGEVPSPDYGMSLLVRTMQ